MLVASRETAVAIYRASRQRILRVGPLQQVGKGLAGFHVGIRPEDVGIRIGIFNRFDFRREITDGHVNGCICIFDPYRPPLATHQLFLHPHMRSWSIRGRIGYPRSRQFCFGQEKIANPQGVRTAVTGSLGIGVGACRGVIVSYGYAGYEQDNG